VLSHLDLRIDDDDRIALIGSNGNGKSTLAKLLAERIAPMGGRITRASKLEIAYFAQHQLDELKEGESPYDHVRHLMPHAPEAKVRARVGTIGFSGAAANAKVATLSGGEKARLMLGIATLNGPNLIILDEPTNHLDIDSRAALIEAINDYAGAVVLISHDRYLIEACADRLWLVGDGTVKPFDGDLDDYRSQVLTARRGEPGEGGNSGAEGARVSRTEARRAAAEQRAGLAPLRAQVAQAEKAVSRWTKEIERLDGLLAAPGLYADPSKATKLAKARAKAVEELAVAEAAWLSASTEYEAGAAAE
jgi:ATP-binding cassette subfamily F protein 3